MRLRLTEIFHSIQGESTFAGRRSAFVRLSGCDLRCRWCDSEYTFSGGTWWSLEDIFAAVEGFGVDLVCVTGGEPLLQPAVHGLLGGLLDRGLTVTLETGGHRDIGPVDPRVHRIVDLKPPGSGQVARNRLENLALLTPRDEVKCVLADRADYEWARGMVAEHALSERVGAVLFSAVNGVPARGALPQVDGLDLRQLAEWVLADRLPVRLQAQLHKFVWGNDARGV